MANFLHVLAHRRHSEFLRSQEAESANRRESLVPSLRYGTEVEVPDRKSICPDRPRRKVSMSRPSQTESAYVQIFVCSKFFVRSSCVQNSVCPDFRAFKRAYVQTFAFKILYDQTLVRSK